MLKPAFHEEFELFALGCIALLRTPEDLFARAPGELRRVSTNAEADLLPGPQARINHASVDRHLGLPAVYGLLQRDGRGWRGRAK